MRPPLLLSLLLLLAVLAPADAARLAVRLDHRWQGEPLACGPLSLRNDAGNELSVTRLAYLLSRLALQRPDGSWLERNDWFAFIDAAKGRIEFAVPDLPAERFVAVRFDLGLPPEEDKGDPARLAAGHPLHPDVNGLHWSWRRGYVFLALEGRWTRPGGTADGYSYHLAGPPCRHSITLPAALDLSGNVLATVELDVARAFGAKHRIDIAASTSTHSGEDGGLAARISENAAAGFKLARVEPDLRPVESENGGSVTLSGGLVLKLPADFPQPNLPADNLPTAAGVALGRQLFHETRLSINNTQSCASCHNPATAFSDPRAFSLGAEGQRGRRHSMPLFNLAWKPAFFWDGRAKTLREQVLVPIQDPLEMHESLDRVVGKLATDAAYPAAFERAFGSREITSDRLARALEQFLLTLISSDAKADRVVRGQATFTEQEQRGFNLFFTESDPARGVRGADCFHCHGGANFTNHQFLNNGLDPDTKRADQGRGAITGAAGEKGAFIVPSLRNVAATAPYMHDGRFATLEDVIEHYDHGVVASETLDPNLAKHLPWKGLGLTAEDKAALLAFLRTLTDEGFIGAAVAGAGK